MKFPLASCLGLSLLLSTGPAAYADDAAAHRAALQLSPLLGGQDLVLDLRTTFPEAPAALMIGLDRFSVVGGGPFDPVFGIDFTTSTLLLRILDTNGRDFIVAPTLPGDFGPIGFGIPIFFQYLIAPATHPWVTSNVVGVEAEPLPVAPGFLVEDGINRLPAGYDSLNGGRLQAADLDKDGDTDLVIPLADDLLVWINDGSGVFSDQTASWISWPAGSPLGTISLVDVNNDSYPDIVIGGGFDDSISETMPDEFWRNTGSGSFVFVVGGFPTGAGTSLDFEFGDFDGDSIVDAAVAVGSEQHVGSLTGKDRIYFGGGGYDTPSWTEDTSFASQAWNDVELRTTAFTAGDVDNDGDLDLVGSRIDTVGIDGTVGQPNLMLVNDGFGGFTNVASALSPNPSDNTSDVDLADLDADGDLDLVFANSHGTVPVGSSGDLYLNQGGQQLGSLGLFVEDTTTDIEISTPADWVRLNVELADLDADGDIDIFFGIHDLFAGADQLLLLNDGGAQGGIQGDFVRQFWFDPGDFISFGVAVFDMDGDGDNDLVQTAQGVVTGDPLLGDDVRIYENTNL